MLQRQQPPDQPLALQHVHLVQRRGLPGAARQHVLHSVPGPIRKEVAGRHLPLHRRSAGHYQRMSFQR